MNGWKMGALPIIGVVGPLVQQPISHRVPEMMTGSAIRSEQFKQIAEIVVDDLLRNLSRVYVELERKYPAVGEGVGRGIRQEEIFNRILYHTEVPAVDYDLYMKVVDMLGARGIPVVTRETRDASLGESYNRLSPEQQAKVDLIRTTWPKNRKVAHDVREEVFRRYPKLQEWFRQGKYVLREGSGKPADRSIKGISRMLRSLVHEVAPEVPVKRKAVATEKSVFDRDGNDWVKTVRTRK